MQGFQVALFRIAPLIFATDMVLLVASRTDFQLSLGHFGANRAGIRTYTFMSEAMVFRWKRMERVFEGLHVQFMTWGRKDQKLSALVSCGKELRLEVKLTVCQ